MAGKTVLIVDDSTTMRTLLKMALAGIDLIKPPIIIEAVDGLDGLNKFRSTLLDFIITDIKMPNMDGLQFIEAVRKENQAIPIIVLSTKGEESSIQRGLELGANDYLLKPLSTARMREAFSKVLCQ